MNKNKTKTKTNTNDSVAGLYVVKRVLELERENKDLVALLNAKEIQHHFLVVLDQGHEKNNVYLRDQLIQHAKKTGDVIHIDVEVKTTDKALNNIFEILGIKLADIQEVK